MTDAPKIVPTSDTDAVAAVAHVEKEPATVATVIAAEQAAEASAELVVEKT